MPENQQVMEECFHCGGVMAHWRINAALRICTGCGNEIHKAEVIMAKHFTDAERAGIQLRLANGEKVKDLAKELGRSYYTIVSIKRAMPKGLKGKKLAAALQAAVDKHTAAGLGMGGLPRWMNPAEVGAPEEKVGETLAAEKIPSIVFKKWVVTIINRRLDMIRDELVGMIK